jgi:glutamine cyclotransferase
MAPRACAKSTSQVAKVLRRRDLPAAVFGEGLSLHRGDLWVLTWREGIAYVLDAGDVDGQDR